MSACIDNYRGGTDVRSGFEDTTARGPRWRDRLECSLDRAPEVVARLQGV